MKKIDLNIVKTKAIIDFIEHHMLNIINVKCDAERRNREKGGECPDELLMIKAIEGFLVAERKAYLMGLDELNELKNNNSVTAKTSKEI